MPPLNNLTGERFGRLTVIERAPNKNKQVYWLCKCDHDDSKKIPTYLEVSSRHLISGKTKSCGCYRKENSSKMAKKDITNQRFGMLVAKTPTEKRTKNGDIIWLCQCDCGSFYETATHTLLRGAAFSCGCKKSFGEKIINDILTDNHVNFKRQQTFPECRFKDTNSLAFFDFAIYDNDFKNIKFLIEFDGLQHFEPRPYGGISQEQAKINFKRTQEHDKFKTNWCKENNILLIRFSYLELKQISFEEIKRRYEECLIFLK